MRIMFAICGYLLVMVIVYTVLNKLANKTGFNKKPYAEEAILWASVLWGVWGEVVGAVIFAVVLWKVLTFINHQTSANNPNGYL